jgi:MFS superfamily sulfate permease-like transporter
VTANREKAARSTAAHLRARDNLRHDLPAGLVVFLVALPLCLGIAFASGAPLFAGLIAGIVGGLIVAPVSKSALTVTGPAAGLFVIVYAAIQELGSYEVFLTAVCLAGLFQVVLGFLRAGIIAYYFPSSVIRGMLAGIGVVLVLKQLPHAFGYNADFEGDVFFAQPDGLNTFTEIPLALGHVHPGSMVIAAVGLAVLVIWKHVPALKRQRFLSGPLAVVLLGIGLNLVCRALVPQWSVEGDLLVGVPEFTSAAAILAELRFPDLNGLSNPAVYRVAGVLAVVASIETLLCVEAIDKLDPFKRRTPTSHELKAQGLGNLVSGLIGGIPVTGVIVRGSANVQSGGRTWMAAFFQGVLLLVAVMAVPRLLNEIPLAALAVILIHIGYRLAPWSLFKSIYAEGTSQYLPFVITVLGIVFTDLLTGVVVGLGFGIFFVLKAHVSAPYFIHHLSTVEEDGHSHARIELADNVSFLNKAALTELLSSFGEGAVVEIDGTGSRHIDHDALEAIHEFIESSPNLGIRVILRGLDKMFEEQGLAQTARPENKTKSGGGPSAEHGLQASRLAAAAQ